MKFTLSVVLQKISSTVLFWLKSDKNNGRFTGRPTRICAPIRSVIR
jgi:hypothetical protein